MSDTRLKQEERKAMVAVDKSRWRVLSPLLDELMELEPVVRAQRMQVLQQENPELAAELNELLREHAAADEAGFLEHAVFTALTPGLAGQTIDRYTLDRQLGEGGMGSVWLAHRSDASRRSS